MSDESRETAVAVRPPDGGAIGMPVITDESMLSQFDAQQAALRCSWDSANGDGAARMIRAKCPTDANGFDICDKPIAVSDWMVHVVELTDDDTGEVYRTLRLVLLAEDGKTYSTTSPVAIDGWADVVRGFGSKTFIPPVVVTFSKLKAKKQGHYIALQSARRGTVDGRKAK